MAVPDVSEKKALAIFQHYPSLTKLMDGNEDQIDEESKIKMMTDIQVSKTFDSSSKARNLGKALSGRFYAILGEEFYGSGCSATSCSALRCIIKDTFFWSFF